MASRGSIIVGAKSIPGGARPTPAPQGLQPGAFGGYQGGVSPLQAQLDTGGATAGWRGAYAGYLPRPTETFTEGAFGPFSPILPVPVDAPADGSNLPDPRLWEYTVGWNLPVGQPGSEGIKMVDFSTLRTLADLYSVARACVQLRKSEVRAIEWDIMPTRDAAKKMRNDTDALRDFGERRAQAVKFFKKPDPDYFSWTTFLDAFLEEVFVFDAASLLVRKKWAKGKGRGILGSDLDSISLINGPTIRPLVGLHGERPRPPAPAYQQYLFGVPRCDLMTLVTDRDIEEGGLTGAELNKFRADTLLYHPMVPRRWTPYGFPPIERALVPVVSGLQKQGWQLDYYREGTVPAVYIAPGEASNMTPNDIRELQDALNAIAGDPAWHHKILVLPAGAKVMPQRQQELADAFDEIVMNQVCMAFDVQPMELGISPKVSTTQSPGAANQMARSSQDIHQRKATRPLLKYLSEIMDYLLVEVCGQEDMRFVFEGLEEKEDEATKTNTLISQVGAGLRSIDEARDELNLQPWGLPETSDPGWNIPASGWIPLADAVQAHQTNNITGPLFEMNQPTAFGSPGAPGAPGVPGAPGALPATTPGSGVATPPPGTPGGPAPAPAPLMNLPENEPASSVQPAVESDDTATDAHTQAEGATKSVKAMIYPHRRMNRIGDTVRFVHKRLEDIVKAYQDGAVDSLTTTDLAVTTLAAGYVKAANAASVDASIDHDIPAPAQDDQNSEATRRAEDQRMFLMALIKAIAGGQSRAKVEQRLELYAKSLVGAYNEAYYRTMRTADDRYDIVWHTTPQENCKQCSDRDGESFTYDTLPGYPGEGRFGEVCDGGPNCGCYLEFIRNDDEPQFFTPDPQLAVDDVQPFNKGQEAELDAMARHARKGRDLRTWSPRLLDARIVARFVDLCDRGVEPSEAVRSVKATWRVDINGQGHWEDEPKAPITIAPEAAAGGGGRTFPAHDVNDVPHPGASLDDQRYWWRVSGSPYVPREDYREGHEPIDGRNNYHRRELKAADAAAPMPSATPPGQPGGAPQASPAPAAPKPAPAPNVPDPNLKKATPDEVTALLKDNYPAEAIQWVNDMPWVGPVLIPVNRLDMDDVDEWSATKEPERVQEFMNRIQSDPKSVNPIVAVQEPGDARISIIDGHHRAVAYLRLNQPIKAYVGFAQQNKGPWKETHSFQIHQGDDPKNKSTSVVAAGVAVLAADTGRVLMLQRSYADEDDPAAGTWEFPGGCLEDGEMPSQAAFREWSEETGCEVPDGLVINHWDGGNGKYRGFVLVVPTEDSVPIFDGRDEVENPDDPDGDAVEALAWWEIEHMTGNTAIRKELADDLEVVLEALQYQRPPSK